MSETPTPSLLQDWLREKANKPYFAAYRGDLLSIAHALDELHSALTAERAARERAEANLLCPGQMRCAKCKFELTRRTLFVQSGTVGAGSSETEPCPNGCGPLWPVTWEQEARACYAAMDRLFDEKQRAEAERDALRAEVARLRSEVPPKLRVGDRSEFIDHNGALRTGECMRVETHYTAATGRHYHIYAMRPDDRMNWKWVGEENICLAKESS